MSGAYVVILMQSTSHALKGESALKKAGIARKLIPVPRHLSSECGVCLRVAAGDKEAALQALAEAQLTPEAVHDL